MKHRNKEIAKQINNLHNIIATLEGFKSNYIEKYGEKDGYGYVDHINERLATLKDEIAGLTKQ